MSLIPEAGLAARMSRQRQTRGRVAAECACLQAKTKKTSLDPFAPQRETAADGGLEWPQEAGSPANIGIMLVRAHARAFAKVRRCAGGQECGSHKGAATQTQQAMLKELEWKT